ncbi:MAG: hypothetical protein OEW87_00610, partial [Flavobacteriaceae bacterium]|nr:hypothetical protein [Flavobacteriaceae bacterium]
MKKQLLLIIYFLPALIWSQTDFSQSWEDFYSYNNVKDFIKVETKIYAVTDNAVFIYDILTKEVEKLSSVKGLSGNTTASIYFSEEFQRLVIGYQTGLIEIVDNDGKITIANDIERLNITGEKEIRHISQHNNNLYLSTPFAIVVYDIEKLQFGDTYFIGNNSSTVSINQINIIEDIIYAATEIGIFTADVTSPNLIDFNNWQQPQGDFTGDFQTLVNFGNRLYTSKLSGFYEVIDQSSLQSINFLPDNILMLKSSEDYITVTTRKSAYVYDTALNQVAVTNTSLEFDYNLQSSYTEKSDIYLGTAEYGILQASFSNINDYIEIHPQGPTSNDVFSISAENNNLWVVYGGYDGAFTPLYRRTGFGHYNGEDWSNTPYNPSFPARDLVHITV